MATAENRTLSIESKLIDNVSRPLSAMERSMLNFARGSASALKGVVGSMANLRTTITGLAAAYLGLRGLGTMKGIADDAAAMGRLAAATGDTTANLSDLRAALRLGGVETSAFEAALRALVKLQADAAGGNKTTIDTFASLGITLRELTTLSPSQLFERLTEGLDRFATQQERTLAVAKRLPGELAPLLPVLTQGLDKFQQLVLDARAVGSTVTNQEARISQELSAAFVKLQLALESVSRSVIVAFGPDVAATLDRVAKLIAENRDAVVGLARSIADGLVKAVDLAVRSMIALVEAIDAIPGIDLFDEDKMRAELEEVQNSLRLIEQLKGRGSFWKYLEKDEPELRARMEKLSAIVANGAVHSLRQSWERVKAELSAMREQVATGAAPLTPDQTAAATGMPTSADWADYARQMDEAMRRIRTPGAGGARPSVFQAPPGQAAPGALGAGSQPSDDPAKKSASSLERFNQGMEDAINGWRDFGAAGREAASSIVVGGLDRVTDALTDAVTGAKNLSEAFKQVAKEVIREIVKMVIKLALLYTLQLLTGMAPATTGAGALASNGMPLFGPGYEKGGRSRRPVVGTLPLRKFERGGIVREPTIALFGEGRASRGEAFVPLPDGRRIPVAMQGGAGAGGGVVHITIHAMDGADVQRVLFENRETISAIWTQEASTRSGVRQTIRGAV